jgi:formylglycine-generating enzyme required for sulfatase activity
MAGGAAPPAGKEFVNSIGMRLVRIEAGRFRMGESGAVPDELLMPLTYPTRAELQKRFPQGDPAKFRIQFEAARHGDFDEKPVHEVTITRAFYMGSFEVTNA